MKNWLAWPRDEVWFRMRPNGNSVGQTIARTGSLATLLLVSPLALAQQPDEPQQPSGTGVQPPTNEELIEKSKSSSVRADAIWIEITTVGENASRWVLDMNRKGSCFVIRDQAGKRTIAGGTGAIPAALVKRSFSTLTKRDVIYGSRSSPPASASKRQMVGIGMATWDGSRVYKTQSGSLESYPPEVQKVIDDLRRATASLPINADSMGSIQSTFLRPGEARRMLQDGKRRIVEVKPPAKNAKQLSTLEMAVMLPGRDIVVPTEEDWIALQTYVRASNPEHPDSGEFFVQSSRRTYHLKMHKAVRPTSRIEDELVPRAKPVERRGGG